MTASVTGAKSEVRAMVSISFPRGCFLKKCPLSLCQSHNTFLWYCNVVLLHCQKSLETEQTCDISKIFQKDLIIHFTYEILDLPGQEKKKKRVQCYSLTHDYQSQFFCMIWIKWKNPHTPNIMLLPTWSCIWVNIDSDFPGNSDGKVCNAGDLGSIPGSGRFPGEGNGNPLQYSCLENSMGREAWRTTV